MAALGLHHLLAATMGGAGESELALGLQLRQRFSTGDLLLADCLYGV